MDSLIDRIRGRVAGDTPCDEPGVWFPVLPPVGPPALSEAEPALGFALHELLRRLYSSVGNGGFGPSYGMVPLSAESLGPEPPPEAEFTLVGQYSWLRSAPPDRVAWTGWRPGLVPVFYCGSACFEFVDCFSSDGTVVALDLGTEVDPPFRPVPSLADRLELWLTDRPPPW